MCIFADAHGKLCQRLILREPLNLMRYRTLLLNTLLLSLLASGWCSALVVVFCAHEMRPSVMSADHECCRAKLEAEQEHCLTDSPSLHEEMLMEEMGATPSVAEQQADAVALNQPTGTCLHCVSRGKTPPLVAAHEPEQKRRGATATMSPPARKLPAPPTVALTATPTFNRGAPPGAATRKYLLFSVFVI